MPNQAKEKVYKHNSITRAHKLFNLNMHNSPHGGLYPPCGKPDLQMRFSAPYLCTVKADFRISVLLLAGYRYCLLQ